MLLSASRYLLCSQRQIRGKLSFRAWPHHQFSNKRSHYFQTQHMRNSEFDPAHAHAQLRIWRLIVRMENIGRISRGLSMPVLCTTSFSHLPLISLPFSKRAKTVPTTNYVRTSILSTRCDPSNTFFRDRWNKMCANALMNKHSLKTLNGYLVLPFTQRKMSSGVWNDSKFTYKELSLKRCTCLELNASTRITINFYRRCHNLQGLKLIANAFTSRHTL